MKKHKEEIRSEKDWDDFLIETESEVEEENTDDQAFQEDEEDFDDDDDEEFDEDAPDTDEDEEPPEDEDSNSDVEASWEKQEEAAKSYDSRHSKTFEDDDDIPRRKHKTEKSRKVNTTTITIQSIKKNTIRSN